MGTGPETIGHWGSLGDNPDGSRSRNWIFESEGADDKSEDTGGSIVRGAGADFGGSGTGLAGAPIASDGQQSGGNDARGAGAIIDDLRPRAQAPKIELLRPRAQKIVTGAKKQVKPLRALGRRKVTEGDQKAADFIKNLLPKTEGAWWNVDPNGAGFIIKLKWRESEKSPSQTFPRISRAQYEVLADSAHAKQLLEDRIYGHLDAIARDPKRRERAGRIAAWFGVALRDNPYSQQENSKVRNIR